MSPFFEGSREFKSLVFLHIPKTAGMTLLRIVEGQYPPNAIFNIATPKNQSAAIEDLAKFPESKRSEIRCLMGHMEFGWHVFLRQPSTYITLVRDPVDRAISYYYFAIQDKQHYLHEQMVSRHMTLGDFVASDISAEIRNAQTTLIAGRTADQGPNMLEIAKRNLREHFAVVGLSDRFDETLVLMKRRLHWGNVFYTKKNVNRERLPKSGIPQAILHQIEQLNEQDIQLYEFAKELFEEQVDAEGASFQKQVEVFRSRNHTYGYLEWFNLNRLRALYSRQIAKLG